MRKIKIGINGFGRIGRTTVRALISRNDFELVAVNDLADAATMAHLLKYDSVHGRLKAEIHESDGGLALNGSKVAMYRERDPATIPWKNHEIDIVIESSGQFRSGEQAEKHLQAGAKKVIISAPASNVKSVVWGINEDVVETSDLVVSNASCTTNCAAPMIQLIDELCGIQSGYITTVHSYTGDQRLHDAPHKDLRRARAAACSIVPTTTGAAKAITKIFPHLNGKLGGCGIRVPVPNGSLTDISCVVNDPKAIDEINQHFKKAAEGRLNGILEYCSDPIVSVDIVGNTASCIFDAQLTSVVGNMVKVVGWYDNEVGYSNRLLDLAKKMALN